MTTPSVLITGINGFSGQHMGKFLLSNNLTVIGVGRQTTPTLQDKRLLYEVCDLSNPSSISRLLDHYQPEYVIHLAAESNVPDSWREPSKILKANLLGTLHVLEAARMHLPSTLKRMLIVGSAQEYGTDPVLTSVAMTEQFRIDPTNPYGWSKMMQTNLAQMYARHFALPLVITRTFNLIGPGAKAGVCTQIARQVVDIESGLRAPELHVGNLQIQRDFLDVRDAISAYWSLLQHPSLPRGEVFNVCSGAARTIGSLIALFKTHSLSPFEVKSDASLYRNNETLIIHGDNKKLCATTGWHPTFTLETSIVDILQDSRMK